MFLVEILLGEHHFFVEAGIVQKILRITQVQPVYNSPPYIPGYMCYKDEFVTLIDLHNLLEFRSSIENNDNRRIVLLDKNVSKNARYAFTADMVSDVVNIEESLIEPIKMNIGANLGDYMKGVIKRKSQEKEEKEDNRILLNVDKILSTLVRGSIREPVGGFFCWRYNIVEV